MTALSSVLLYCFTLIFPFSANSNSIQVIDTVPKRSAEVKEIVEFYFEHLNLENHDVVIFMSPDMNKKHKAYLVASFHDGKGSPRFTQINVDNKLKGYHLAKVIGHELYHLKQMQENRLCFVDNKSTVKWKGKSFKNIEAIPYEERPWEKECKQREITLGNNYLKFRKEAVQYAERNEQVKSDSLSTERQITQVYPN